MEDQFDIELVASGVPVLQRPYSYQHDAIDTVLPQPGSSQDGATLVAMSWSGYVCILVDALVNPYFQIACGSKPYTWIEAWPVSLRLRYLSLATLATYAESSAVHSTSETSSNFFLSDKVLRSTSSLLCWQKCSVRSIAAGFSFLFELFVHFRTSSSQSANTEHDDQPEDPNDLAAP